MPFTSLLINSVDFLTASGTDAEGAPMFTTVASGVSARVEFRNRQVVSPGGEIVLSNVTAFIAPPDGFSIKSGDEMLYGAGYYRLLEVRELQDDRMQHHLEVLGQTSRRIS